MTETTTPTSANDTATKLPAKSYEPTSRDRKAMQAYFDEQRENPPPPRLKVVKEDEGIIGLFPDHPDLSVGLVLLIDAMGLKDQSLGRELLSQMSGVAKGNEDALNAMIAFVRGLEPKELLGGDARDANGSDTCVDHAPRKPTRQFHNEQGTRTRRTRAEQTRQDIRFTDRNAEAIPYRGRTKGHGSTRHSERQRPSDCRECVHGWRGWQKRVRPTP